MDPPTLGNFGCFFRIIREIFPGNQLLAGANRKKNLGVRRSQGNNSLGGLIEAKSFPSMHP